MKIIRGTFLSIVLLPIVLLLGACANETVRHTDPVVEQLQQGGYVIFFRHAATDHSQKDIDKKKLSVVLTTKAGSRQK